MPKNNSKEGRFTKQAKDAASIISSLFGFDVESMRTMKDNDVKKLGKDADNASIQSKRMRAAATHQKRLFHSAVSQNKIIQGVIRVGLDAVKSIRREEAKTAKHAARIGESIRVLDERTGKAIDLIGYAANKEIENIGEQHDRSQQLVDARYTSLSQVQKEIHSDLLTSIQNGYQRRIEQSKTPWKD